MSESKIQREILKYLETAPSVAYFFRHNVGAFKLKGRYVRFGVPGQSDILGILKGGRFLAIEVKRPKKNRTPAQVEFQETVNNAGGLAFVARNIEDVMFEIEEAR